MDISVDTVKMRECGKDIIKLSMDFRNTVDAMFDRIDNMPVRTGEWVGEEARMFARLAQADKTNYVTLKDDLYKYGKYLIDYADYLEQNIDGVRR